MSVTDHDERDRPAEAPDDAVDDGQAQAGVLGRSGGALALGGEERFEGVAEIEFGHAHPGVRESQEN